VRVPALLFNTAGRRGSTVPLLYWSDRMRKECDERGSPRADELYVTAIARQSLCNLHHDGLQIHLYELLLQSPCPIIDA
jgi:hypothetical protein